MDSKPILYVKHGCPWCRDALDYFDRHGVALEIKDVLTDKEAMQRMIKVSRQSLTPTLEYGDFVVADFSVAEFRDALAQRPEVKKALGLQE